MWTRFLRSPKSTLGFWFKLNKSSKLNSRLSSCQRLLVAQRSMQSMQPLCVPSNKKAFLIAALPSSSKRLIPQFETNATPWACVRFTNGSIHVLRNSVPILLTCTPPTKPKGRSARLRPPIRKKSWFSVAAPTALAKGLNLITAVCTPPWRCEKMAMKPSWSTATPRRFLRTTIPATACTLSL